MGDLTCISISHAVPPSTNLAWPKAFCLISTYTTYGVGHDREEIFLPREGGTYSNIEVARGATSTSG
jgi:hypothetical protein